MSLTSEQIATIAENAIVTVAQNIDDVKGNAANMSAILAVWTALSAIKLAPDAAYAAGLSEDNCAVIQKRCEDILENVQAVVDVVPATPVKLGVCRGDQKTIATMNGILSLMSHHMSHEPGGSDAITAFSGTASGSFSGDVSGNVAEKFQSLGTISGEKSIDLTAGNIVIATIGGATTFSFSGVVAGMANTVMLKLTNAGSATITWPSGVLWPGGQAPTLTAAGLDVIVMETDDDGATWVAVPNLDVKGAA